MRRHLERQLTDTDSIKFGSIYGYTAAAALFWRQQQRQGHTTTWAHPQAQYR